MVGGLWYYDLMTVSELELAGTCRSLEAWRVAMEFVMCIYSASNSFPSKERFALTQQLRRAAVSVPANISEGSGRRTAKDFAQFLAVARASLRESETLWLIARRLGYAEEDPELNRLCASLGRLLTQLLRKMDAS